jgi:hypothetical protein
VFAVNHSPTNSDFLSITARKAVTKQRAGLFFTCIHVKTQKINVGNKLYNNVANFIYLRTTLTNREEVYKEIDKI